MISPGALHALDQQYNMLTVDLHFHANIIGFARHSRNRRLKKYAAFFQQCGMDFQASTEHSYKKPVETYLALAEAARDIPTAIIPGVESVSSEGVDMIFLFRDEDEFKRGFRELHSFAWSVSDTMRIARSCNAVTVVPHPFFISKAAGGPILGRDGYRNLLKEADYVEIHNGSALNLRKALAAPGVERFFPKTVKQADWTLDLPMALRGKNLGWAVGSDAHCPAELYVAGCTEETPDPGEDPLDFLRRRIRFTPRLLMPPPRHVFLNNMCIVRSMGSASTEYVRKKALKLRGRLASLGVGPARP